MRPAGMVPWSRFLVLLHDGRVVLDQGRSTCAWLLYREGIQVGETEAGRWCDGGQASCRSDPRFGSTDKWSANWRDWNVSGELDPGAVLASIMPNLLGMHRVNAGRCIWLYLLLQTVWLLLFHLRWFRSTGRDHGWHAPPRINAVPPRNCKQQ